MSVGNLKTEGGKGTNWPWQYKMLKGIGSSNQAFMARIITALTPNVAIKSITILNSGASTGTIAINGGAAVDLEAGETVTFNAGGNGNTFPAGHFTLTPVSSTFVITYVH